MNRNATARPAWYRIPVIWLAILVLVASLAGGVVNIVIALQHADGALAEVAPGSRFLLPAEQP